MIRSFFTLLLITIALLKVNAQFIFGGCNNRPVYGDSLTGIQKQYDSTGIESGSSGANVTWTFSALSLVSSKTIFHFYIDPLKTKDTSASSNTPLFPSANLADSTLNGFISYYQYSSDSVTYLGNYKDVYNYDLIFGSEKSNLCPLSFGNSYSESFHVHPEGVCTYDSYINRTVSYDAYGTLNLGKLTYSAARLKFVEQETDTFCSPFTPPAFKIDTTYEWYDISNGLPV